MYLSEAIRKRINELSLQHNLAIPKWSIKAGINPTTMYSALKGKSGSPKIQTIKLLCEAIDITLSDFFDVDYINKSENEEKD